MNRHARVVREYRRCDSAYGQAGVGLIEVLIAVLVLSIGFLGVAALQAMSLSTNNSAMARSMATIASYSILDAMRTDISNVRSNAYNTSNAVSSTGTCTAAPVGAALATVQLSLWCQQLTAGLGSAATTTGAITCTPTSTVISADCTITVTFDDSRAGVGGTSVQTVVTRGIL